MILYISTVAILIVVVPLPEAFVAVTIYNAAVLATVGVPVILPVDVLNERPVGSVPLIL